MLLAAVDVPETTLLTKRRNPVDPAAGTRSMKSADLNGNVLATHALRGGESDCRNRTLHQLFLQIGYGERAGSGLPRICEAWTPLGYKVTLADSFEPYDQTLLRIEQAGQPVPTLAAGIATCPPESAEARVAGTEQSSVRGVQSSEIEGGISSVKTPEDGAGKSKDLAEKPRFGDGKTQHLKKTKSSVIQAKSSVIDSGKSSVKNPRNTRVEAGTILEALRAEPTRTIPELATRLGLTTRAVEKRLAGLRDSGRLRRIGPDHGGHWEVL